MAKTLEDWRLDAPGAWARHLRHRASDSLLERRRDEVLADSVRLKQVEARVGVGFFPSVVEHPGFHGFLLRVEARPMAIGEPIRPELIERIHRWIASLAGVDTLGTWATVPLVVADRPEDVVISGDSLGLAAAGALISTILGEPPRVPLVVSAVLGAPGAVPRVLAVDGIDQKSDIVCVEAPGVEFHLAEVETDATGWLCRWFGVDWQARLVGALGTSPQADALEALLAFRRRGYGVAREKAELAVRAGARGHALAIAEWVVGAVQLNQAETASALTTLERARVKLSDPPEENDLELEGYEVVELEAFLGVALIDRGRPGVTVDRMRAALDRLSTLTPRNRGWKSAALQTAGTLHRALVFSDRAEEAASILEWSLAHAALSEERARCLGDLAEVCRRRGDITGARQYLVEANGWLARAQAGHRPATARFLRLFESRCGVGAPNYPVKPPDWSSFPQPAEVLETLLTDHEALGGWGEKHVDASVTFVQGLVYAGATARSIAAGNPAPTWFSPLVARLAEEPGIDMGVREMLLRAIGGDVAVLARCAPY